MEIKHMLKDGNMAVAIDGEINTLTAPELRDFLDLHISEVKNIIFDFKNVEYISSAGLRILLKTQLDLRKKSGKLMLKNLSPAIAEVFRLSGFDKTMDVEVQNE